MRRERFNAFGFQQMHADMNFFYAGLCDFVGPEEVTIVSGLIDEVISSCINRSDDFKSMDETVIESMVQFKLERARKRTT